MAQNPYKTELQAARASAFHRHWFKCLFTCRGGKHCPNIGPLLPLSRRK